MRRSRRLNPGDFVKSPRLHRSILKGVDAADVLAVTPPSVCKTAAAKPKGKAKAKSKAKPRTGKRAPRKDKPAVILETLETDISLNNIDYDSSDDSPLGSKKRGRGSDSSTLAETMPTPKRVMKAPRLVIESSVQVTGPAEFLDMRSICRLAATCRLFREIFYPVCGAIRLPVLDLSGKVHESFLRVVPQIDTKVVKVLRVAIDTDGHRRALSALLDKHKFFPDLRHLTLECYNSQISDVKVAVVMDQLSLASTAKLHSLTLVNVCCGPNSKDAAIELISSAPDLQSLWLAERSSLPDKLIFPPSLVSLTVTSRSCGLSMDVKPMIRFLRKADISKITRFDLSGVRIAGSNSLSKEKVRALWEIPKCMPKLIFFAVRIPFCPLDSQSIVELRLSHPRSLFLLRRTLSEWQSPGLVISHPSVRQGVVESPLAIASSTTDQMLQSALTSYRFIGPDPSPSVLYENEIKENWLELSEPLKHRYIILCKLWSTAWKGSDLFSC
ncbi:hypothetical protein FOL47_008455 [Perkinsus chesapeaki]|uniref:Uncharacterized protein n=1 Tax=Perkinsus chesapeaki TaxID=330153 RepID=A0A7J6LDT1_PERCH|nr:hypothetical protein FOL47_008455 [Perkinsus chesapeaki]